MYSGEILDEIRDKLTSKKETLAVAESVTAGHLQAAFSSAKLATQFFQGGITVYNLGQKCRQLDVEPIHAEEVNCVSDLVATQMALAVARKFVSEYGISVTGYASAVPELKINETFAWICITHKQKVILIKKINSTKENPVDVQIDFVNQILAEFSAIL